MDLKESSAETAFREEVRAFLRTHLPPELSAKVLSYQRLNKEEIGHWHHILHRHGWGAPKWPKQFGGPGWSPMQIKIFEEESALAGAPRLQPQVNLIGSLLHKYGTQQQQERFLPRILAMEEWWCQGYSEPGAGSDLASLGTRAVREGDQYVVNGQKIWTSQAHWADWIFCLVRTSTEGKKQAGITFLLIDMKTPGITVRPIRMVNGDTDFCEVFLQDVRVPVANRVGDENAAWDMAKHVLAHERIEVALLGPNKRLLMRLKQLAVEEKVGNDRMIDQPYFKDRLVKAEMKLLAHEWLLLRLLAENARRATPGPEVSILKLQGSTLNQELSDLLLECTGAHALANVDEGGERLGAQGLPHPVQLHGLSPVYLDARRHTIYGGSSEIQKNLISKLAIGF